MRVAALACLLPVPAAGRMHQRGTILHPAGQTKDLPQKWIAGPGFFRLSLPLFSVLLHARKRLVPSSHSVIKPIMLIVYNALILLFSPLLLVVMGLASLHGKYRSRIPARLGFALAPRLGGTIGTEAETIWVHALSVGEVTSAGPLLCALRAALPEAHIVLSVATRSGEEVAREQLAGCCHAIIAAPYDLYPSLAAFIRQIKPRVFILVETDFWPNWLHLLARRGIPTYLVNGRISERSFARYRRAACFFVPMFRSFTGLCMQTRVDADNMARLGLDPGRIHTLGNLKCDGRARVCSQDRPGLRQEYGFDAQAPLFICGSTHAGEEELLLSAYVALRADLPRLQLLLAPRQIGRADSLAALAARHGLSCRRRSQGHGQGPFLLLDTLGELAFCYAMADLAFIGGSLVPLGGHNPVEAAACGIATCFGPHMEDFGEIAADLLRCGGAVRLKADTLLESLRPLVLDSGLRDRMGQAALHWLKAQEGTLQRHLELIIPHCRDTRS